MMAAIIPPANPAAVLVSKLYSSALFWSWFCVSIVCQMLKPSSIKTIRIVVVNMQVLYRNAAHKLNRLQKKKTIAKLPTM